MTIAIKIIFALLIAIVLTVATIQNLWGRRNGNGRK